MEGMDVPPRPKDPASPWLVYVLECDNGSLYTGVTNDLPRRLKAHREGRGAKFTRMHPPRKVLMTVPASSRNDAQRIETWFKGKDRGAKLDLVQAGPPKVMEKFEGYRVTREGDLPQATFLPKPRRKPAKKKKPRRQAGLRVQGCS